MNGHSNSSSSSPSPPSPSTVHSNKRIRTDQGPHSSYTMRAQSVGGTITTPAGVPPPLHSVNSLQTQPLSPPFEQAAGASSSSSSIASQLQQQQHAALSVTLPLPSSPRPTSRPVSPRPSPIRPRRTCLMIVDVQNDFCTGTLKAPDALTIIPVINSVRVKYDWDLIVFTGDSHPVDHISFYINHAHDSAAQMYHPYVLPSGATQVLWPVHCVRGTYGAAMHSDVITEPTDIRIEKGTVVDQEFYSAFLSTDRKHHTDLASILHANAITHVATCGLVYEYCVGNSALDSVGEGFTTCVITDATRGLTPEGMAEMRKKMEEAGVNIIHSSQLAAEGFQPRNLTPPVQHQPQQQRVSGVIMPKSPQHQYHPSPLLGYRNSNGLSSSGNNLNALAGLGSTSSSTSLNDYASLPSLSQLTSPSSSFLSTTTSSVSTASTLPQSMFQSRNTSTLSSVAASAASSSIPSSLTTSPHRPKLLLGLSGSVACIKIPDLLTLLTPWCEVRVIVTQPCSHFISAAEIEARFNVPVFVDEMEWKTAQWKRGDEVLHVELRRWADFMLVAPLSANTLAKIANGMCDNLLTTVIRCWDYTHHPLLLAPAMNTMMWDSHFTRQHLNVMRDLSKEGNVTIIDPIAKTLACGDIGVGAMAEVENIEECVREAWKKMKLQPQQQGQQPPQQQEEKLNPNPNMKFQMEDDAHMTHIDAPSSSASTSHTNGNASMTAKSQPPNGFQSNGVAAWTV